MVMEDYKFIRFLKCAFVAVDLNWFFSRCEGVLKFGLFHLLIFGSFINSGSDYCHIWPSLSMCKKLNVKHIELKFFLMSIWLPNSVFHVNRIGCSKTECRGNTLTYRK